MTKILFICHGNICRSPAAELIFCDLAKKRGVGDLFSVASAATSTEELGNPIYPPMRNELRRRGYDCAGKYAVQVTRADYDNYDLLVCMDARNVKNLLRLIGGDPDGKVRTLTEREIEDPWYTERYEKVCGEIAAGCENLLEALI